MSLTRQVFVYIDWKLEQIRTLNFVFYRLSLAGILSGQCDIGKSLEQLIVFQVCVV